MTYQLLQNKHKLSADLMIADTLSQNDRHQPLVGWMELVINSFFGGERKCKNVILIP